MIPTKYKVWLPSWKYIEIIGQHSLTLVMNHKAVPQQQQVSHLVYKADYSLLAYAHFHPHLKLAHSHPDTQ